MSITVPLNGFGGGGGTSLNFTVKAYPTEEALMAATPKANTIGIITENKITSWEFSATEPSAPEEGMVWISVGTSSPVALNVLKKNAVQVYPLAAKQYVGGAWVNVTAMSYQDGQWKEWFIYVYRTGDQCVSRTGGWAEVIPTTGTTKPTISWKDDSLEILTTSATSRFASVYTNNPINVDGVTKLYARISGLSFAATNGRLAIGLRSAPYTGTTVSELATAFAASIQQTASGSDEQLLELELGGLSGDYYIQTAIGLGDVVVHEIYLV